MATPVKLEPEQPKLTVSESSGKFLAWLERHRGKRTHYERSRHLSRFTKPQGKRKACEVMGERLWVQAAQRRCRNCHTVFFIKIAS